MRDKALRVFAWEAHWLSAHLAFMGKSPPLPPPPRHTHTHTLLSKPCSHMTILKKYIETASLVTCTNLSLRFTFKLPHVYLQNKRRITKSLSQGQMSNFTCVEPNAIAQE